MGFLLLGDNVVLRFVDITINGQARLSLITDGRRNRATHLESTGESLASLSGDHRHEVLYGVGKTA
jgi:hypothetical protein